MSATPTVPPKVTEDEFLKALLLARAFQDNGLPKDFDDLKKLINDLATKYGLGPHPYGNWGLDAERHFR